MRRLLLLLITPLLIVQSRAITITIDYTYDSTGFFTTYTDAKNALEQAATDIGSVINSSLGAVSTDMYTGTNGSSTATVDWSLNFTNPTTGAAESLSTFSIAADTIVLYAGARNLTGSTLGVGGPGSAGISVGASAFEAELTGAVNAMQTSSNNAMGRGGDAPTLGTLTGGLTIGATTANYSLNYSPLIGNIWFDTDTNNDTITDDASTLNASWHFDHTTAVASGKNDFYSVALHEVLHGIGIGTSDSWDNLISGGTNWTGTEASTLHGTGTGLIDAGEGHIASGIMSTRISDGGAQEVVMDPSITTGTRKTLTALDIAFLNDINYSASAVPEPAETTALFGVLALLVIGFKRRRLRPQA